jgi:hypothetical protein
VPASYWHAPHMPQGDCSSDGVFGPIAPGVTARPYRLAAGRDP